MRKRIILMLALMFILTSCASTPKTDEMIDILNKNITTLQTEVNKVLEEIYDLKDENEKLHQQIYLTHQSFDKDTVYLSNYVPNKMGPRTVIEFISENEFLIQEGYAVVGYDINVFEDIDKKPGVIYEEYPAPHKGMVVTYTDDGLLLRII